jgi:DNA-binding PadR family transcriptional regulator
MYVDILILSLLMEGPNHAYGIKKYVGRILGYSLNNNLLYPALHRFEEMGAVRREVQRQQGRPDRHVYQLTDLGIEVLQDMMREFPPEMASDENEFQVRVAFFGLVDPSTRLEILETRRAMLEKRLTHVGGLVTGGGRERIAAEFPYAMRLVEFQERQTRNELDWIAALEREIVEAE